MNCAICDKEIDEEYFEKFDTDICEECQREINMAKQEYDYVLT